MTLVQYKKAFKKLKKKGRVESHRKGPTGIGHMFELLIGLNA